MILFGVFLAVIAAVGVIAVGSGGGGGGGGSAKATPTPTPAPTTFVVYAKVDITLGQKITADMVEARKVGFDVRDAIGTDTFDNVNAVVNQVAGTNIPKGQPLRAGSDLLKPGTIVKGTDLAPIVAPGKVAVAMEVDQINGVGTLLVNDDRIDIILSVYVSNLHIQGKAGNSINVDVGGGTDVTTKMVMQNKRVLVTLLPAANAVAAAPDNAAAAGGSPTPAPKATSDVVVNDGTHMIVIVEVNPDEAEIIRWAQREEKLDPQNYITLGVALRSAKDNDAPDAKTPGITFKQLVQLYGVLPPDPRAIIPADIAAQISW
jgi:Flp pilus assembly protein CpaB